jgi:hypothetical protein
MEEEMREMEMAYAMSKMREMEMAYAMSKKAQLGEQPYAIYGNKPDPDFAEVPRTPRLEQTIHRVQGMRERLIAIGINLNDATDMVVGSRPIGATNGQPAPEPNGLIDVLGFNLDLLERDIAVIGDTVERLREGL